jgi:hypothetical protein
MTARRRRQQAASLAVADRLNADASTPGDLADRQISRVHGHTRATADDLLQATEERLRSDWHLSLDAELASSRSDGQCEERAARLLAVQ